MFRHLLTIPSRDRRAVRLLAADVGLTALHRVRARFRSGELSRRPGPAGRPAATAVMWTTTSALLALADAVTAGDIAEAEAEATRMAVGITRATAISPRVGP